jgi:hypothetical protein
MLYLAGIYCATIEWIADWGEHGEEILPQRHRGHRVTESIRPTDLRKSKTIRFSFLRNSVCSVSLW